MAEIEIRRDLNVDSLAELSPAEASEAEEQGYLAGNRGPAAHVLTPDQKRRRIERLKNCIHELEKFDPQRVQKRYEIPQVMALEASIKDALAADVR